ncbi:aromatic ring-hydroxylating oxygenase subunit alpha [Novosphingobium album (ex Hu et al. 2023)]|uniref:Aromatic ring-hydroxylating dioxygenase subunit alpha n=1 Tax=Novosphingobium album (ex Hu et al. 2023) TaxID=2930093 RepID=A0ABT0B4L4_9SPHN|nr:aromatic ring-hydroxylating dioxygenase subunit alpha [Novosphingobium album (ex Hu et al. 2023)]MCJ2179987.1 aromatic ring-hydroxylating dioxygenase subunit alpha [Novosphingobium album (ex Hu et al. 2023)]
MSYGVWPQTIGSDAIRAAREALFQPIERAEGLPGSFYGEAFFELERSTLFPRSWSIVAVGAAIPNPGDILPLDFAGYPVLLVRGKDGEVKAFHNICRHRAIKLVHEPCEGAKRLRCPWHSWAYDLDGNLLATPELGGEKINRVEGFEKAGLGLKPIPVGRWLDYIFINLDGVAEPFESYIAPLDDALARFRFDGLRHGGRVDKYYEGNWKLAMEGGIEDYHLTFGHPQLGAQNFRNSTPFVHPPTFAGGIVDLTPADGSNDGQSDAADARLPELSRHDRQPMTEMLVFNVFPTGTVLISPDHVMLGLLMPEGASRTRLELHLYYEGDAATAAHLAAARSQVLQMWLDVVPQDFPFVEGTQATIMARDAAGIRTRFSPYWEVAVHEFQKMIIESVETKA